MTHLAAKVGLGGVQFVPLEVAQSQIQVFSVHSERLQYGVVNDQNSGDDVHSQSNPRIGQLDAVFGKVGEHFHLGDVQDGQCRSLGRNPM